MHAAAAVAATTAAAQKTSWLYTWMGFSAAITTATAAYGLNAS